MSNECPKCRTSNVDGAKFCRECGKRLRKDGLRHANLFVFLLGCLSMILGLWALEREWAFAVATVKSIDLDPVMQLVFPHLPAFVLVVSATYIAVAGFGLPVRKLNVVGRFGFVLLLFSSPLLFHAAIRIGVRLVDGRYPEMGRPDDPIIYMAVVGGIFAVGIVIYFLNSLFSHGREPSKPTARILGTEDQAEAESQKLKDSIR